MVCVANAPVALAAADEAMSLAGETRQFRWRLAAQMAKATIFAERDSSTKQRRCRRRSRLRSCRWGPTRSSHSSSSRAGEEPSRISFFAEGRDHLQRMFDPADTAYHPLRRAGARRPRGGVRPPRRPRGRRVVPTRLESLAAEVPGTLLLASSRSRGRSSRTTRRTRRAQHRARHVAVLQGPPAARLRRVATPRAPRGGVEGAPACRARDLRRAGLQGGRRASSTGAPRVGRNQPPPSAGGLGSASPQELQIARMARRA